MNNYERMRATNSIARKYLEENGYYQISFFPHNRYTKDIFNLFDFVCKKGDKNNYRIYWGQVKTGYATRKQKKSIIDFCFNGHQNAILIEYVLQKEKQTKRGIIKHRRLKVTPIIGQPNIPHEPEKKN